MSPLFMNLKDSENQEEGNILNLVKEIYKTPTATIMFNDKLLNAFLLANKQERLPTISMQHYIKNLSSSIRHAYEITKY